METTNTNYRTRGTYVAETLAAFPGADPAKLGAFYEYFTAGGTLGCFAWSSRIWPVIAADIARNAAR